MTLSEEFEKETGKDSEFQDLTYGTWGCSQDYVEWLEAKINYTRCCESVKDKYTHTFEVDLNSEKRKEQYNKHIEQIHNAPCKVYLYDGDKYIELKP
jgi:hypothetical protein